MRQHFLDRLDPPEASPGSVTAHRLQFAPLRSAPHRFALLRSTPFYSALLRSALLRSAQLCSQPLGKPSTLGDEDRSIRDVRSLSTCCLFGLIEPLLPVALGPPVAPLAPGELPLPLAISFGAHASTDPSQVADALHHPRKLEIPTRTVGSDHSSTDQLAIDSTDVQILSPTGHRKYE